jgi:MFS transporter, ACS family, tartrate transporter
VNTVFSVAGFVGPSVVGWSKDATGSTSGAFLILAGLPLTAAVLCVLVLGRQPAFSRDFASKGGQAATVHNRRHHSPRCS